MPDRTTVSQTEFQEVLGRLDDGYTLPSAWYTDPGHFAYERDAVLRRGWQYGGHTGDLAEHGDQITIQIAGVPVVLVVDESRTIRGFVNICRHRAHLVVHEPRNRKTLQCLYHGWTYGLDGCLRRAPRAENELDFDPSDFGLIPVQTAVWGPTVWVNIDPDAPPFFEWIDGLPELVERNGVNVASHRLALERRWEIDANWKVFLDNAIECYHCPTCHPALSQVLDTDPARYELSVGGRYWISHRAPLRRSAVGDRGWPTAGGADGKGNTYFHWIFPTTYFLYAGQGFDVGTVEVTGVNTIALRHLIFLPVDASNEEIAERERLLELDPTVDEDVAICKRVQAAHDAGVAPPGRLLPGSEWLLLHFQRVLVEDLAARPDRTTDVAAGAA
jgi:choline monooxygenase